MSLRALALCLALAVAGCGSDDPSPPPPPAGSSAVVPPAAGGFPDPAPAAVGGSVGPGTACPIPVAFTVAAKWVAEDTTGAGLEMGNYRLRCEIDAKPAGLIGFLRVWVNPRQSDVGADMRDFLERIEGGTGATYRSLTIGGQAGYEASFRPGNRQGRAFAVRDTLVVWTTLDDEEFTAGLPAYVLARTTVSVP